MNTKKLYEDLESLSTKEIQVMVAISVRYLCMARGLKLKSIIKDLKNIEKILN